ncbi:coatomer epsilon subunit-domain-containing protein [Rhodotorula diobovata]|uniref:Coatomer epsilon subunit-domain-containing protein n=1 Tax=Rhodotorula diobovata TaxID=5288 RepID=A0A5C5G1K5_9BASI|nr:coatomer epsilon subunit-domain-containing protein [Rhodotorula diobovata]
MDSESFYIVQLFSQGSYRNAIAAYNEHPSPSPLLTLYAARAHLALTPPSPSSATQLLSRIPPTLDARAVGSLARYLAGETDDAVGELEELLAELGEQGLEEGDEVEGRFVRGVVGTVWVLEGEERREEGIEVLREAVELGKDQECLAILSHLYIQMHLPHLSTALLTAPSTTAFTSDSLLSQLLIARSNLATGPASKYQDAYYVFEEIKGMQGGRGEAVLGGVSVAQALLGRWEEARDATNEALEMNPTHPTSLANSAALALHTGKPEAAAQEILARLQAADAAHPLLADLAAKSSLFDDAASRFAPSATA